jgi:hypothetical protein
MTQSKVESILRRLEHTAAISGGSHVSVVCLLAAEAITSLRTDATNLRAELGMWQELHPVQRDAA